MKKLKNDASKECYFDFILNSIGYINPYNKKQIMIKNINGFQILNRMEKYKTGKKLNQKIIWKKINSIKQLRKGDFIKIYNLIEDKNYANDRGIITKIKYKTNEIIIEFYQSIGVSAYEFKFDDYTDLFKAVYLGDKK